uniref:Uncharacterized protein n=1 Tax=Caenorhabditis japonica TaxID=281687 RepID=A0A8R1IGL4_CAEJA
MRNPTRQKIFYLPSKTDMERQKKWDRLTEQDLLRVYFLVTTTHSRRALFLKCLDAPGIEPSRLEVTVSSIFKAHLDNVFAAARSKIVKRCRTGDAEQPSTSA